MKKSFWSLAAVCLLDCIPWNERIALKQGQFSDWWSSKPRSKKTVTLHFYSLSADGGICSPVLLQSCWFLKFRHNHKKRNLDLANSPDFLLMHDSLDI